MKAIATKGARDVRATGALELIDADIAEPDGYDLRVRIEAISVNPVDTKVRAGALGPLDEAKILGWDAVGRVEAVGDHAAGFAVGDRVYYAGQVDRPGCNAEQQLVDSRLVAHAPASLEIEESAAMPLTGLTAWEGLFDQLQLTADPKAHSEETLLVINGAGGVGSSVIQLARQLTGLTVIATASRPQSVEWCRELGAHEVIDHHDLINEFQATGRDTADYIFNCHDIGVHWENMVTLIRPLGRIVAIAETEHQVDLNALQPKAASFSWEFMFARALHGYHIERQGEILAELATLLDEGRLRSTLGEVIGPLNVENLTRAHEQLEAGHTTGKLVLTAMR
ncbi:zinc-binding alcohol dehydrogenase family protein [Kushneria phosphatilytica]|uniref:Zinc-type alcohol dehydrogenase-like protein n=1 Tax=Kushneria phosphatilytica TaxID=657387 RepID=A0A1S1NU26_9GAMM|nr:zinc-binding alcohol dehydrogenase family protein [Kushneria phosphatilytica]OHV13054.1 Zn-dependent oxidoreductase [Kushneria phosphatilytica]QEL10926.1 zinc-binding alcohol dehydrogenase family protein [Kushneria phosphatilytica]